MLDSIIIPYNPTATNSLELESDSPASPLATTSDVNSLESMEEKRARALEQSFLVLKLHLMRLADGEDAVSAFLSVRDEINQIGQRSSASNLQPIQSSFQRLPFGHIKNHPMVTSELSTSNSACCCQPGNQINGCAEQCWCCKKPGALSRNGLYSTCDECEENRKCLFCEATDKAASFHYGAPVCEKCKGRFRSYTGLRTDGRTSQPKACDKGGNCSQLSKCTDCWAAKCLPVYKDIYEKWVSQSRRPKRLRSESKRQISESVSAAIGGNTAEDLINGLVKSKNSYDREKPIEILFQTEIMERSIDYVKDIIFQRDPLSNDFKGLNSQDQYIILQQSSNEILLLRYTLHQFQNRSETNFMIFQNPELLEFLRSCDELKLTLEEFELLTAIVLFSPDCCGLTDSNAIKAIQNCYVGALQEKFGNERTISLIFQLLTLRKLAQNHVMTFYPNISVSSQINQMSDSDPEVFHSQY